MKAFLLAAGLGTRLRPLTDSVPKCLVPIAGRPLLVYWLALLERHGFDEVLLNVHHLPERVSAFVASHQTPIRITVSHERELLGSAGTVRAHRQWLTDGEPFLIAYADNLTAADLSELLEAHQRHGQLLTAALFRADQPSRCGIVELAGQADSGPVISFEEKPTHPKSNLANAGLYVTDKRVVEWIPDHVPADFGHHVLPRLVGQMAGHLLSEPLIDVGTWESYERAQTEVLTMGVVNLFSSERADS